LRAHRRRANDASVQHAVDLEIVDEDMAPAYFARNIGPSERLTDDSVRRGIAQLRLRIDLDAEPFVADEIAEAYAGTAGFRSHLAVDRVEVRCGLAGARRGEADQCLARGGGRLPDLHAAARDAAAAGGGTLVGRQRGIAFDQRDTLDADAELLGRHLRNRDAQALAEIHLARVDRHRAVGVDRDEAVDLAGIEGLAARDIAACALREDRPRQGEADDQGSAGLQEFAARHRRVHAIPFP